MRGLRIALLALGAFCLVLGVAGGLLRLGVSIAAPRGAAYHGFLMTGGFLGTVIALERAIALARPWALVAPFASALSGVLLLLGEPDAAAAFALVAPMALVAIGAALLRRQREPHIVVLTGAAACWGVGNLLAFTGATMDAAAAWWFAFLVLTIAAERLEMTRLLPRRPFAAPLFHAICALLLLGAALSLTIPRVGGIAFGAGLVGLAAWLAVFDIARRTVHGEGFARYAAVALLGGYAWLAFGGGAWIAMALTGPAWRDAALHALGLGFVFSMILAHAPIVVPVVARVRMAYAPFLYVPLVGLHASLLVRVTSDWIAPALRGWGGLLNAAALGTFAGTLAYALSRRDDRTPTRR